MTKQDRQKAGILAVLLGVLALTIFLGYRMNQPQSAAAVQPSAAKNARKTQTTPTNAHIRLDLLESQGAEAGERNLFQYPPPPRPPAPDPAPKGTTITAGTPPPMNLNPGPSIPPQAGPPQPPPPPPITLRYQGYATTPAPAGGFVAFLADDAKHFNVTTGEILMGRYRITSITEKAVEVEDLTSNRRQVLSLQK